MRTASGLFRCLAPRPESGTIEHMAIRRMEHVGIVVDDLAAATEFFVELGLVLQGEAPIEGRWVDRTWGSFRASSRSSVRIRFTVASDARPSSPRARRHCS
jgi:catechol 2,3-dioxygenase-like lactoylglutathione lyase family enzyme